MDFDSRVGTGTEWIAKEVLLSAFNVLTVEVVSKEGWTDKQVSKLKKQSDQFPLNEERIKDLQIICGGRGKDIVIMKQKLRV